MKDWLGWQRDKEWSFKLRVSDFTSGYDVFHFYNPDQANTRQRHTFMEHRTDSYGFMFVFGGDQGDSGSDMQIMTWHEPAGAVEVEWAFVYRWSGSSSPDKSDWTIYGRVKDASSWGEWYDQTSEWSNHKDNYDVHDGSTWAGSGMRAYFGFKPSNSHYAGPYIHDLELWNGALALVNGALTPPASSGSSAPTPSIAMSPYDGAWIAAALSGSSPSVEAYRLHALPTADRTVPLLHASVSEFYHDNFGYSHIYSGDGTHLFVASRSYEHPQGQDPSNTWFYERDFVRGTVYVYRWDDARGWVRKGPRIWAANYKVQATRDDNFGDYMDATDDGNTVIIAGPEFADSGNYPDGYVAVFEWNGTAYARKGQEFRGPHYRRYGGNMVGISNDGKRIVFGESYASIFQFYDNEVPGGASTRTSGTSRRKSG